MKPRLRISPPRLDDGTALPAALCACLGAVLVAQFAMAGDPDLPEEGIGRVGPAIALAAPPPSADAPATLGRPLFSPTRRGGGVALAANGAGVVPAGPLGGAIVSGAVSRHGAARAFLKLPDGSIRVMGVGGSFQGWRLAALTADGARFVRAGEAVTLPFGSAAPAGKASDEDESSDE